MIPSNFDTSLLYSYQIGIAFGILVLSTLILFPGRIDPSNNTRGEVVPVSDQQATTTPKQSLREQDTLSTMENDENWPPYWTPHRRMNYMVYGILLIGIGWLWTQSYDSDSSQAATAWRVMLEAYFPREAAVLKGT